MARRKTTAGGLFDHARESSPLTVSQVAAMVRDTLAQHLPPRIMVIGEISNLSARTHLYFSIKDEASVLSCACWATQARRLGFTPRDGMEVLATGRIDFWAPGGRLQFYVERMEPAGLGRLEAELRRRMIELRELGYFEDGRKRPLPLLPRRVAVVTSRSAAALQDVIQTAQHRWPGCALALVNVLVQGEQAAGQIAAALEMLSRRGPGLSIDVIILTRGGGSIEDLWAFNERIVADSIFNCRLPVVAAIGHETDTTIAELVADLRCSTPTQAAMRVVPDGRELARQLDDSAARLAGSLRRTLDLARSRLNVVARQPLFAAPHRMVQPAQQRCRELERRLAAAMRLALERHDQRLVMAGRRLRAMDPRRELVRRGQRLDESISRLTRAAAMRLREADSRLRASGWDRMPAALRSKWADGRGSLSMRADTLRLASMRLLERKERRIEAAERHLSAIGPRAVLKRGYSVTLDARTGRILRDVHETAAGERIVSILADGQLISEVVSKQEGDANLSDAEGRV
ncbi:MAG: exodeoxyribonuclease VII large subunit [Phycisphaeraceae bacterium]|nr:exodeoxyribonuclease VII large subunit [Phycisphaeraceae bacterium]